MKNPLVFDIKRYSTNDGPGIRITVFFKGCPLSCLWCHNPEGISPDRQKMYTPARCIGCQTCAGQCPQGAIKPSPSGMYTDAQLCTLCTICAGNCPSRAMEITGEEYSIERLAGEIEKEIIFIDRSGGGLTVCGGEPLMQPDALAALLQSIARLGIHRAVDTSLYASRKTVDRIMPHTDLFLIDLKLMDSARHNYYCGVPNEIIHSNLVHISEARIPFAIRIPLIEGINADEDNILRTARFISSLPTQPTILHLLPYHDIARGKHARLGSAYNPDNVAMSAPSAEKLTHIHEVFYTFGIRSVTGGGTDN